MDALPSERLGPSVDQDGRMDTESRLVPLQGSFNFRDLGGYPGSGGRLTRWGRLYRADALHELTVEDVVNLRHLGLRTIVDLRTERELARSGRGPLEPEDVAFHHLAVVKEGVRGDGTADRAADGESVAAPAPAGDDLAERYLWYLDVGRASLVESLTMLGGEEHYPLVFHCAAGKDRTGVLAALILSILGVEREVIVADYVITAERLRFIMERWLADPEFAERMAKVPATRFSVEAPTMEGFLDQMQVRYGGARQWALDAGVPAEVPERMLDLLLEPGS
jgi:protein-tyrosine phosphatase